jgi:hypothetical protein
MSSSIMKTENQEGYSADNPPEPGSYDAHLYDLMQKMVAWLSKLEPITKNPKLYNDLLTYSKLEYLLNFRQFFLEKVKPKFMGPSSIERDSVSIGLAWLRDYGFMAADFGEEDFKKFCHYLKLMNQLIRVPAKK